MHAAATWTSWVLITTAINDRKQTNRHHKQHTSEKKSKYKWKSKCIIICGPFGFGSMMPSCALLYSKIRFRKCNRLSLPPLHKKDKRLENSLWDTIIFFQMKNNQANNAYHKSFDTICDGFFTLVAFCLLDPSREKASCPHFQINESKISDALFHANVVGGIHPSVTSNSASYPLFLQHIFFCCGKFPHYHC